MPARLKTKGYWCNGRLVLYLAGFSIAAALDPFTPQGIAEWLIDIALVSIATIRGGPLEMVLVAAVSTVSMLVGLWSSPSFGLPLWLEAVNRLGAIGVIWVAVHIARQRRRAEAETKILRGLLPICATCKQIRYGENQWQSLESYISGHSEATFSHGLCPVCFEKYYAEIDRT